MSWNSLVSLNFLFYVSVLKGLKFKPNNWTFDLIKISTQILNKISNIWQNEK